MRIKAKHEETENFHRFKIKLPDINGTIYIHKGMVVPSELIVDLSGSPTQGDITSGSTSTGPGDTFIENGDQAQAVANILWNQMERCKEDTREIKKDLETLKEKWGVTPIPRKIIVRP